MGKTRKTPKKVIYCAPLHRPTGRPKKFCRFQLRPKLHHLFGCKAQQQFGLIFQDLPTWSHSIWSCRGGSRVEVRWLETVVWTGWNACDNRPSDKDLHQPSFFTHIEVFVLFSLNSAHSGLLLNTFGWLEHGGKSLNMWEYIGPCLQTTAWDTHRLYGGYEFGRQNNIQFLHGSSPNPQNPTIIPGPGWLHWKSQGTWSPHGLPPRSRTAAKGQVGGGVDLSAVCSIDLPCCWEELVVRPAGLSNFVGLVQRLNVLKLEGELRNYKNTPPKKIGEFFVWGNLLMSRSNDWVL